MRRAFRLAAATMVIAAALAAVDAGAALAAKGSVLVYERSTNGSEGDVAAATLRSLGYTASLTEKLPVKLSAYSAIWAIRAYDGFNLEEQEALEAYVRGGGRLYLTGERPCCELLNESDQAIARAVLKNQEIVVGGQGDIAGTSTFNISGLDRVTTTPHALGEFLASAPGGIANVPARNVLASNGSKTVGAAFDEHDMVSGKGRLVIYMDVDWLAGPVNRFGGVGPAAKTRRRTAAPGAAVGEGGEEGPTTRLKVVENLQDFLENTPTRIPPTGAEYVGMGDSYASGLGGGGPYLPGTEGGCSRATSGYIEHIAIDYGLSLRFAACAGATIKDLWEGKSAQLNELGPRTRYVTLSIGGNDVGFSSVIKSCVGGIISQGGKGCAAKDTPAANTALEWLRYGREPGTYKLPGGHGSIKTHLRTPGLAELYEAIHVQAPEAQIVAVGYPHLLEGARQPVVDCQVGKILGFDKLTINSADVEWINSETDSVDNLIRDSAATAASVTGADIRFADPRNAFAGHGVCDTEADYINPALGSVIPTGESFHPNRAGQETLRFLIEETGTF